MGIPENSKEVHGRNSVFSNIRSKSSHTDRDKLVQCPGFRIHSRQEFEINAEIVELVGGTLRIDDYTAVRISVKTCPKVQQGHGKKRV